MFRNKSRNLFQAAGVYLCRRKVCTMLLLMTLRASHTSMATEFLVRALVKLSLGAAAAPPVCPKLVLLISRPRGLKVSILADVSCSKSEETEKSNGMLYRQNNCIHTKQCNDIFKYNKHQSNCKIHKGAYFLKVCTRYNKWVEYFITILQEHACT